MDVSDVEENDDPDDVPPSPRPPAQPRHRVNSGRPASYAQQPEPRRSPYDDESSVVVRSDRPPSRNRKQTPPAAVVYPNKVSEVLKTDVCCVQLSPIIELEFQKNRLEYEMRSSDIIPTARCRMNALVWPLVLFVSDVMAFPSCVEPEFL